mmetsp:Transcript_28442/g.31062  ORF Transcript_28442/g.31062 Transcript_28442/m.31062 type:complete len:82 (+) Transcript_28442:269-514(+)
MEKAMSLFQTSILPSQSFTSTGMTSRFAINHSQPFHIDGKECFLFHKTKISDIWKWRGAGLLCSFMSSSSAANLLSHTPVS